MRINKAKIINEANNLLLEKRISVFPVNLFDMLEFLDLEYMSFDPNELNLKDTDPDEVSAFISYIENKVFYNQNHSRNRVRFSLAHEIGHARLGHQSMPHPPIYNSKSKIEIEANLFASELLIPTNQLQKFVKKGDLNIPKLSTYFGVSEEAVTYRLNREGLIPSGYDFLSKSTEYRPRTLSDIESNLFAKNYPIEEYGEEDCEYEKAYEYYYQMADDLPDLKKWIDNNGDQDDYENMYKAICVIIDELEEE